MNTSSNRYRFQEVLEHYLGCHDPTLIGSYKIKFENVRVTKELEHDLECAIEQDACSIFYKASLSIADAVASIYRGYYSWAVVKLYYATFYLVRLAFAVRGYGVFRCSSIYTLKASQGAIPQKRQNGKGDHKILINAFIDDYSRSEPILSNKIDDKNTFEWLMGKREAIHYKDATFNEPQNAHFDSSLSGRDLGKWISEYLKRENTVYCFLEGHACLAIPLVFCRDIVDEAENRDVDIFLRPEQQNVIQTLLNEAGLRKEPTINELLVR